MSVDASRNLDQSTIDRLFGLFDQAEQANPSTLEELRESHQQTVGEFLRVVQNRLNGLAVWLDDAGRLLRQTQVGTLPDTDMSSPLISERLSTTSRQPDEILHGQSDDGTQWVLATSSLCSSQTIVLQAAQTGGTNGDLDEALLTFAKILAGDYRRVLLSDLLQVARQSRTSADFFHSVHSKRDAQQIAVDVANDGAMLCDADRLSVVFVKRGKAKLAAVTSVVKLERRAESVEQIEQLVQRFLVASDKRRGELVAEYSQATGTTATRVEPVGEDAGLNQPGTVLVLDQFEARPFNESSLLEVIRHSGLAIQNANSRGRGLLGVGRFMEDRAWRYTGIGGLVFAMAMWLIPADFEITAVGQLQPVEQRIVFAPDDGVIVEVMFTDEDSVNEQEPLLKISSPALELKEETISGEFATVTAQLASVQAARLDSRSNSHQATPEQLTAEEEELKQRLKSLSRQLDIVRSQLQDLTVAASIDGMARRRDFQTDLLGQPVRRGQPLLGIVKPDGAWQLELRIPDRSLRHVLAAHDEGPVQVDFRLQMSPETTWSESMSSVAAVTDLDESGRLSAFATATLTNKIPDRRPGAGVVAKVNCGRRSLGYVWFRELWEFVQIRVF